VNCIEAGAVESNVTYSSCLGVMCSVAYAFLPGKSAGYLHMWDPKVYVGS
jgi:hypothetical protein